VCSGRNRGNPLIDFHRTGDRNWGEEVRAMPTHVGVTLLGTILFAISLIFRVWG
jgi:hypothetical protein